MISCDSDCDIEGNVFWSLQDMICCIQYRLILIWHDKKKSDFVHSIAECVVYNFFVSFTVFYFKFLSCNKQISDGSMKCIFWGLS